MLLVVFELHLVVSLGEDALEEDRVRHAIGVQVLHGLDHPVGVFSLVALDIDVPHLHLGAFIDVESDLQGGGRNLLDARLDGGVLMAALGEKLLQRHHRALHLVGIVLRFHREADLALLEAVQNFGDRDRVDARVVDGADHAPLDQHPVDDDAGLSLFGFQADIVEAALVPQQTEIAAHGVYAVDVPHLLFDDRLEGVLGDAAGALEIDGFDHLSLGGRPAGLGAVGACRGVCCPAGGVAVAAGPAAAGSGERFQRDWLAGPAAAVVWAAAAPVDSGPAESAAGAAPGASAAEESGPPAAPRAP